MAENVEKRKDNGHYHGEVNHEHRRDSEPLGHLHRRVDDCEQHVIQMRTDISALKNQQSLMAGEFAQLNQYIGRMAEIMEAWNNAKGFWSVMQFVTAFVKVAAALGLFFAAIWVFLKTGVWIDK